MDGISLQMQAFRIARNYWFHIEVFDITYRNGAKLICGTFFFLSNININLHAYRPSNPQELFNLRHAQARNIIERIFGVLKRRFRILQMGSAYRYPVQAQIPAALCAIHNFIRIHDGEEEEEEEEEEDIVDQQNDAGDLFVRQGEGQRAENDAVVARRNNIAQKMWQEYQAILQTRQEDSDDDSETTSM